MDNKSVFFFLSTTCVISALILGFRMSNSSGVDLAQNQGESSEKIKYEKNIEQGKKFKVIQKSGSSKLKLKSKKKPLKEERPLKVKGKNVEPDEVISGTYGQTIFPDGTNIYPSGESVWQDGTTVLEDGTTIYPDGTTVYPDGSMTNANGEVVEIDQETLSPDI